MKSQTNLLTDRYSQGLQINPLSSKSEISATVADIQSLGSILKTTYHDKTNRLSQNRSFL
jgi:hypothetical protein